MSEETDWSGPMLANFEGVISAEKACKNFTADLKLHYKEKGNYVANIHPTLTKVDIYTYSFKTSVEADNLYGYYMGKLHAYDYSNQVDQDYADSEELLWEPPCYLEISKFEKLDQDTTIDSYRTNLEYSLGLKQHGHKACNNSLATV